MSRALVGLVLSAVLLAVGAAPARAADGNVTAPGPNVVVEGPTNLAVVVTTARTERVPEDGVLVRLLRGGVQYARSGVLRQTGGVTTGGRGEWGAGLDPLRSWMDQDRPMPNGLYEVQTQVTVTTLTGDRRSEWRGHGIRLKVPPPPTTTTSRELSDHRVEVSWQAVTLPDFRRYDVERSADGATWTRVASVDHAEVTRAIDAPPRGTWRYRTLAVRSDGDGGELAGRSAPASDPTPATPPGMANPSATGLDPAALHSPVGPGPVPSGAAAPQSPNAEAGGPAVEVRGADRPRLLTAGAPGPPGLQLATPLEPAIAPSSALDPPVFAAAPEVAAEPDVRPGATGTSTLAVASSGRAGYELLRAFAGGLLLMVAAGHVGWQLRRDDASGR